MLWSTHEKTAPVVQSVQLWRDGFLNVHYAVRDILQETTTAHNAGDVSHGANQKEAPCD
jgi:hypothetical protein